MIGATFCSGIGAPEMAAPWIDWRFASEIEPFPRAVLQERFGYKCDGNHNQGDPLLWGDMATIDPGLWREAGIPLPEIVVAGTPCQAFSIAGLRKGLKDARGNLTMKFVEICHAIVDARPDGKLKVLWENVLGVLSDKENAFGNFLAALVGADDAFPRPNGESWPSAGMVAGPRARLAWRVLDAQYFGVAQRRRRVFVVIDFGDAIDPAKVLFERQGLQGNTPPRREAGEIVTGTIDAGSARRRGSGMNPNQMVACFAKQALGEYADNDIASTCSARDYKDATDLVVSVGGEVSHTLAGEGFDASEDGSGSGTPVVVHGTQDPITSDKALPLGRNAGQENVVIYDTTQVTSPQNGSNPQPGDPCHPLAAGAHPPAIAFMAGQGAKAGGVAASSEISPTLRASESGSNQVPSLATSTAVRRLMPMECARLQGFPDNHTEVTYRGKPASDGPQYKGYGNSMAVPVIRWILERMTT